MKTLFLNFLIIIIPVIVFSQKVEVVGSIKIVDGTQGANKVLTSDANGLASWKAPATTTTYYPSVNICTNTWMSKNLDVVTYRNGDSIPKVENAAAWAALTTDAYCYYNNDSATYAATYGKLYNWYAVNDPRGLAPEGWHVPTEFEWTSTANCLGGATVAGGILKELGTAHWPGNTSGTDMTGFTALPGGNRSSVGTFAFVANYGYWWSTGELNAGSAWTRYIINSDVLNRNNNSKRAGLSVRCVKG